MKKLFLTTISLILIAGISVLLYIQFKSKKEKSDEQALKERLIYLSDQANSEEVMRLLNSIIDKGTDDPFYYILRANMAMEHSDKALSDYQTALEKPKPIDPKELVFIYLRIGEIYLKKSQPDNSLINLNQSLQLCKKEYKDESTCRDIYFYFGKAHFLNENYNHAVSNLETFLKTPKSEDGYDLIKFDTDALEMIGDSYQKLDNKDAAIKSYQKIIDIVKPRLHQEMQRKDAAVHLVQSDHNKLLQIDKKLVSLGKESIFEADDMLIFKKDVKVKSLENGNLLIEDNENAEK